MNEHELGLDIKRVGECVLTMFQLPSQQFFCLPSVLCDLLELFGHRTRGLYFCDPK